MTEIWRDIRGYEGLYQVSDFGRVKSFWFGKEKILKPGTTRKGYLYVCLCKDGRQRSFRVHRLVAEAFIPNPKNLPEVDHIDTDKANCRVDNLRWTTHAGNMRYAYEAGLIKVLKGEESPRAKLTEEQTVYIRENPDGLSVCQLAEEFGIVPATVSKIQLGQSYKNAGGKTREPKFWRLPDEQRAEVRRLYRTGEYSQCKLAKMFGCNKSTIYVIIHEE